MRILINMLSVFLFFWYSSCQNLGYYESINAVNDSTSCDSTAFQRSSLLYNEIDSCDSAIYRKKMQIMVFHENQYDLSNYLMIIHLNKQLIYNGAYSKACSVNAYLCDYDYCDFDILLVNMTKTYYYHWQDESVYDLSGHERITIKLLSEKNWKIIPGNDNIITAFNVSLE